MKALGKFFLLILVACYVSTIDGESDTVINTASDGVKTGAKVVADATKNAG
jgi:hypothetical protein